MRRFLHRLALALGEPDVDALAARLTVPQLLAWMRFDRLEPFGERRSDLRAALICATLANLHRDPRKRPRPYRPQDFMPDFGAPPSRSRQSPEAMRAILMAAAQAAREASRG